MTNIPEKCYFPNNCGWYGFNKPFFEGGIREPLRFAKLNFVRFLKYRKSDEDRPKTESGTSQGVSKFVKPIDKI